MCPDASFFSTLAWSAWVSSDTLWDLALEKTVHGPTLLLLVLRQWDAEEEASCDAPGQVDVVQGKFHEPLDALGPELPLD